MAGASSTALGLRTAGGVLAVTLVLALTGVALVLTEPWDSRGPPAGARADDPLVGSAYYSTPAAVCGLLDADEIELALGFAYHEGVEVPLASTQLIELSGLVRCAYPAENPGAGGALITGVVYAYAEQVFQDTLARYEEGDRSVTEIEGLGDRAVWSDGVLLVLTEDKLVGLDWVRGGIPPEERFERTRRLAEKALERLR